MSLYPILTSIGLFLLMLLSSCEQHDELVDEVNARHTNTELSIAEDDGTRSEFIRKLKNDAFYVLIGKGEDMSLLILNSWGTAVDCERLYKKHKADMLDLFFDSGAESVLVICYEDFNFQKPSGESRIVCLPVRGGFVQFELNEMKLRCQIDELFCPPKAHLNDTQTIPPK